MSLLKKCSDLNHHSLESFILECIEGDSAYRIYELGSHPQIKTISQKVSQVWKIFCTETYQTAKQSKALTQLNDKQIKSLRKLSILNIFQGKYSVTLSALCNELDVDKITLFRLITEMSSRDLITVKIDERTDICSILASKRRLTPIANKQQVSAHCQARLTQILHANRELTSNLQKMKN